MSLGANHSYDVTPHSYISTKASPSVLLSSPEMLRNEPPRLMRGNFFAAECHCAADSSIQCPQVFSSSTVLSFHFTLSDKAHFHFDILPLKSSLTRSYSTHTLNLQNANPLALADPSSKHILPNIPLRSTILSPP